MRFFFIFKSCFEYSYITNTYVYMSIKEDQGIDRKSRRGIFDRALNAALSSTRHKNQDWYEVRERKWEQYSERQEEDRRKCFRWTTLDDPCNCFGMPREPKCSTSLGALRFAVLSLLYLPSLILLRMLSSSRYLSSWPCLVSRGFLTSSNLPSNSHPLEEPFQVLENDVRILWCIVYVFQQKVFNS